MITLISCRVCKEDSDEAGGIDSDFGLICKDCSDGIENGTEILARERVRGSYYGPCPDNQKLNQ